MRTTRKLQPDREAGAQKTGVWGRAGACPLGAGLLVLAGGLILETALSARSDEASLPLPISSESAVAGNRAPSDDLIAVASPPFSEDIFPCSECHDGTDVDRTRRVVEDHETIIFEHDAENRWCLDCHDAENRDMLHLANGDLLSFDESYRLCGQCHGPKLRDWKAGEHGKRTGEWAGKKRYLLCAHCHDPHSPKIKPMAPMPPPTRPEDLR